MQIHAIFFSLTWHIHIRSTFPKSMMKFVSNIFNTSYEVFSSNLIINLLHQL